MIATRPQSAVEVERAVASAGHLRVTAVVAVTAAIYSIKAAIILRADMVDLSTSIWLIDDSFIMMRVARNIALGLGFSFDGVHPTTGVSPLWAYLTALNHLLLGKEAAVKLTLLQSGMAGAVAAVMVFLLARRATGCLQTAWVAFLLVSLLPVPFFNAMNGMETAFFTLMILASCAAWMGIEPRSSAPSGRRGLLVVLFAGLALVTRADALFFCAALLLVLGGDVVLGEAARRTGALRRLAGIAAGFGGALLVLAAWNAHQTGEFTPANQSGRHAIALLKQDFDWSRFALDRYARLTAWHAFELEKLVTLSLGSSLLALFALHRSALLHAGRLARLTGAYAVLFAVALVGYQWYFPDYHGLRYLNPVVHLLVIPVAALVVSLRPRRFGRAALSALVITLLVVTWRAYAVYPRSIDWAAGMNLWARPTAEERDRFWAYLPWVQANIPREEVVALWDHGLFAYVTDLRVQDLAGILDGGVTAAWRSGTLGEYLRGRGVSYVYLPEPSPGTRHPFQTIHEDLSLSLVPDSPPQHLTGFRLYRVEGQSTP